MQGPDLNGGLTTDRRLAMTAGDEPGHLHLERRTRRWLAHAADGTLQPYPGSADLGPAEGRDPRGALDEAAG
jgi:hypothetical protein